MQPRAAAAGAEDEDAVLALLGAAGMRPAGSGAPPPIESVDVRRDHLVLDAACGGREEWSTTVRDRAVDYTEGMRLDGSDKEPKDCWAASVSVVLSLYVAQQFRHDETGSGRAERHASEQAAIDAAERAAIESARRRLAKMYASALGNDVLGPIERQARAATSVGGGRSRRW